MPSEQNGKTSDDILEELFSSIKTESASESSHNEVGSSSEEDEERRERKKKKSHKHKKSKKKKKKHKRSRSDSRSRDRSASDETSKRKKRDSQRKIKTAPLSPVREVKREPLSPPASYRSDYYPSDDRHASKRRRVPPPPPPEEWVKKESSSRYEEDRHSERDRYSRHRERSSRSRERSRFRDHSRSRDHSSRHRDHSRSRDRSSRHRDRSRSRDRSSRHKDWSRERDRSRSRDRSGRNKDRSRERDRSRSRDRKSRRKDRSRSRDEAHSRKRRTSTDERPPKRTNGEEDPFWESKWEAMQVQSAADEKEKKGRLFLQPERQKVRTPTPEFDRDSSPETSELKNLKRLKEIENLVVKENEKYVAEPPNPDMFEWDEKTKMRRKKIIPEPKKEPESSDDEDADKKIDPSSMTLDEIEELQRKKDKKKKKKEAKEEGEIVDRKSGSREKEDGELRSDDEDRHTRSRSKRSDRKYREHSRSRDYRRRSPKGYGYRDRRVRSRSRDRFRDHRRRSRSRSRSRDGGDGFRGSRAAIDKAKLLAIAQKNAVKLLNSNDLKGMNKDRLVAIKSGGQSLSELTIFCRELAKKGITDEFSDEEAVQESDEEKELNHPFMVRDRPLPNPILLGMQGMKNQAPANGLTLSTMTPAMRDAARSHRLVEFPVSSGNAHRVKEDDVEDEEAGKVPTGMLAAQTAVTALVAAGDPIVSTLKIEPKIEGVTMSNPLGALMFGGAAAPLALPAPRVPTPPPPIPAFEFSPEITNEETKDTVFETKINPSMDISTIISVRLNAMKRLSSNPNDPEALRELYDAQQEMSKWADSKNKPGQFTGTTGAKILSKGELLTGVQAWAKQEQFTTAQKVSGGFGEYMLRKMGWREGDGLGKERSGTVDPLQLDIKMDKRGLMAPEEGAARKKGGVLTMTGLKDVSGKHPVTAIIEVSTKKRWGPPTFAQVFECGVAHRKQYIWKVTVNGVEYQPTIASDNKKKAKANAATVALQELGMLPKDPNNPL